MMMTPSAKLQCDQCDSWLDVESKTDHVECSCGTQYAVTITLISGPVI